MKNLMIDLETLGTKADAIILSLSAVAFDMDTGKTGDTFHVTFDIDDCVKHGLKLESSTLKWWFNQTEDARRIAFTEEKKLYDGMRDFCQWYFLNFGGSDPLIWGNGPKFDLGKIEYSMDKVGLELPWKHWAERCYRTAVDVLDKNWQIPFEGVKHYGIDDCKHQIKILTS